MARSRTVRLRLFVRDLTRRPSFGGGLALLEDGALIGSDLADLLLEDCLTVELKAAKAIAPEHEAQILGDLKSACMEHGLPISFGSCKFEIRKYLRTI